MDLREIKRKQRRKMEKRGEKYYSELASKLILEKKRTCTREELVELIQQTDTKLGLTPSKTPKEAGPIATRFIEIFRDVIEDVRMKKDDSERRGVGIKRTTTVYSLSTSLDCEKAKKIVQDAYKRSHRKKKVSEPTTSLSKTDMARRDIVVEIAKDLEKKNTDLQRKESIKIAKRTLPKVSVVKNVMFLINKACKNPGNIVESFEIRERFGHCCTRKVVESWFNSLEKAGVRIPIGFKDSAVDGRSWSIQIRERTYSVKELEKLAEAVGLEFKIEQSKRVVPQQSITARVNQKNDPHLAFIVAGLIMECGSSMTTFGISSILRNNSYHKIDVSDRDLYELAQNHPDLFDKPNMGKKTISLVGNKESVEKILKKINPANQPFNIGWCINSGLDIKKIKEIFPESYIDHEEVEVGSRIVIVRANNGILGRINLMRLQKQMRNCDFPIGMDRDFLHNLEIESSALDKRFDNFLIGLSIEKLQQIGQNDQTLLRLEQRYL